MAKMKSLQLFIAEEYTKKDKTIDLEKGIELAKALWNNAMIEKESEAIIELNGLVRRWGMESE